MSEKYVGMSTEQLLAAIARMEAEQQRVLAQNAALRANNSPRVTLGEYKGHKVLTFAPENARPFNIGVTKFNHVLAMQDIALEALTS